MTPRRAIPDDLDTIEALERKIFPDDAWPRVNLEDDLRSPHAWFLVMESDESIVG